jgi:hypothetical protein
MVMRFHEKILAAAAAAVITLPVATDAKKEAAAAQVNLAYSIGVQAYLYGHPIMDLY